MSIESVDTFEPSSSTPVFGSGVSQTKLQQQQPSKDVEESEKSVTPSDAVVNGQTDSTNNKTDGTTTESAQEHPRKNGTIDEHANGENKSATVDTIPLVQSSSNDNPAEESIAASRGSDSVDKSSQKESASVSTNEPTTNVAPPAASPKYDPSAPTESETALSISVDEGKEDVSSTAATHIEHAPPAGPSVATTSEDTTPVAAPAAEAIAQVDSASSEPKARTPRGKVKSPVVSTLPTRQSTRARKPVASTNEGETETTEDITPTTTSQKTPTSTRGKRQAATTPKDTKQTTPTAGSSSAEKVRNQPEKEKVRSDVEDHGDSTEGKTKTPTPRKGTRTTPVSTGQKREASSSPSPSASKKQKETRKGRKSTTKYDNEQMNVVNEKGNKAVTTIETELAQTPPKKARTSANKTTPTSKTPESSEEYMRKLRPRK
ncbi:unnamed protein product [Rotaria magnacalcarata]|uniref:Uncharacterized protein n=1 Tax=Rotaria magnacalcarata TaxID=392030 RepID=A0A819Z735_9BILA|nr:unnamed protein product [Rotaria magnacalcarata]CAF4169613.1 unnamed protein product [Rotaria magnacalcarata]